MAPFDDRDGDPLDGLADAVAMMNDRGEFLPGHDRSPWAPIGPPRLHSAWHRLKPKPPARWEVDERRTGQLSFFAMLDACDDDGTTARQLDEDTAFSMIANAAVLKGSWPTLADSVEGLYGLAQPRQFRDLGGFTVAVGLAQIDCPVPGVA